MHSITQQPYKPRNSQDVILQILQNSLEPYHGWGWVFRLGTLGLIALVAFRPERAGRVVAAYFGLNYLFIAGLQTTAHTRQYGFAIHTGEMVAVALLGLIWLSVAWRDKLEASFEQIPGWRWVLLPFALLVFWSPFAVVGDWVGCIFPYW